LKALPGAIVNTLFRPFIWESKSLLILLSALENLAIYLLAIIAIFYKKDQLSVLPLLCFSISFVVLNLLLTGFTVPVLGAIVRYRIFAVLFLSIACILIVDKNKFTNQISRFWKHF
jgi:hypothetical protein